jgi:hypothetical protein
MSRCEAFLVIAGRRHDGRRLWRIWNRIGAVAIDDAGRNCFPIG